MTARTVPVPPDRLVRWCENFGTRHGTVTLDVRDGGLHLAAEDGESAEVLLPFGRRYAGAADPAAVADAAAAPLRWGVLLVRKGGFAVAVVDTDRVVASKVGQRHVQGRTKAGGQSQQRFARRRDNQARQAYEAAADHAHRVLVAETAAPLEALVCGGDRAAVDQVLADPRLARPADGWPAALADLRVEPWLPVPDPRRAVLDQTVADARSLQVHLPARPQG